MELKVTPSFFWEGWNHETYEKRIDKWSFLIEEASTIRFIVWEWPVDPVYWNPEDGFSELFFLGVKQSSDRWNMMESWEAEIDEPFISDASTGCHNGYVFS
jgi:hypothetical protein